MTVAWIIGSRGMLGSATARAVTRRAGWSAIDAPGLPWTEGPAAVQAAARAGARQLREAAGDERWNIIWAAGAVVTASTDEAVEHELVLLESALQGMRPVLEGAPNGGLFYASSAGGVYAGSAEPPFTEASEPHPIAPYGSFKLRAEAVVTEFARSLGVDSLVGRIANLYGPGQRLDKLQGLISHIALARLTGRPASIYVPLDTLRDYLYVDDAGELVLDALERLALEHGSVTKILGSGQSTTIATLLGHFRALSKGKPRVVLGSSAAGSLQAHDLRLRSTVWPELDAFRATSLPEGIRATITDIERAVRAGGLS